MSKFKTKVAFQSELSYNYMMNFSRGAYLMAIQKLVQSTHPVLTKQAQPIKAYDATLKDLLLDLKIHYMQKRPQLYVRLKSA